MAKVTGGEKAAAAIADIVARAGRTDKLLRVGFLENATYPDGTLVAMVAAIQNYGAPAAGIPPRPFFSNMVRRKQAEWAPALGQLLVRNKYDVDKSLKQLAEGIKGQLQDSIQQTNSPPLKPATVKRKGFSKPLIDTGQMLNSVSYEVK
jgi:hypothetical protein